MTPLITRSTRRSLLAAAGLAGCTLVPRIGFAQEAPAGDRCVPNEEDGSCLSTAPEEALVDRARPTFTNPTKITNPLFPISDLNSVVMLGRVDRLPFRTEVTLLPETKVIAWDGQEVEVLVSQYAAFLDGRIHEVAIDWYAQADDGSVWYFGEDVFNYEDGDVADTHGTWLAGKDGPAAMIMPANPQVGDVYRPENIPGVVYEEVTVLSTGETVSGPRGRVEGAIVVQELHQDGTHEEKIFAPGYGEFLTGRGGELEALALAVPTDALSGPMPAELERMTAGALAMFDAAGSEDWSTVSAAIERILAAWETLQDGDLPALLAAQVSNAMIFLVAASDANQSPETRQAALDIARAGLDLQLQYRLPVEIDLARLSLHARQVLVDAAYEDAAGVTGDVTCLEWTRDRVVHSLDESLAAQIEELVAEIRATASIEDLAGAAVNAVQLLDLLASMS